MCDHRESKLTYIEDFDIGGYAVYMCECGALIDLSSEENWGTEKLPMSPTELTQLIRYLFNEKLTATLALLNGTMKL